MKYLILLCIFITPAFADDYQSGYNTGYTSDVMNYDPMSRYGEGIEAGKNAAYDDDDIVVSGDAPSDNGQ